MSFFCWKCNQEMPDGTETCPKCGAPVTAGVVGQMETIADNDAVRVQIITGVTVAGRYRIKREIGRGGMGIVYLAHDKTLDRDVALKVIPYELCQDPRAIQNLKRETLIALELTHKNIVRLYNLETWEGQAFVIMEYVAGQTLAHFLVAAGGKLSFDQARPLLKEIAAALDYAHTQSPPVVHRDLKPLNILMTADGHAKIGDYGLARVLQDSATRISMSQTAGTLAYMAPEQIRGKGIGPGTDIYAFACLACEILSGEPPFSTGDLRWQIIHEEPELSPELPVSVRKTLLCGLAKDPAQRPHSARVLVAGLTDDVSESKPVVESTAIEIITPPPPVTRSAKSTRPEASDDVPAGKGGGKKWLWIILLLILGAGIGIASVLVNSGSGIRTRTQTRPIPKATQKPTLTPKVVLQTKRPRNEAPPTQTKKPVAEKQTALFVYPNPAGARVRILNIGPVFVQGMKLDSGQYLIEVSKPGYQTQKQWIELKLGQRKELSVILEKSPTPVVKSLSSGATFTDKLTGMQFVWVPGGCFQMGSPAEEKGRFDGDGEGPVHMVCVDGFWMGKYEVSNAEYRRYKSDHDSGSYKGNSLNGDKQPVVEVSWEESTAFAEWLSNKSGRKFHLPTEAEWEYACRAGTTTARFWGDNSDYACAYANVADQTAKREWSGWTVHNCSDGFKVSSPVGSFRANGFGLYDMLGNVWEWCWDWYGKNYYADSPVRNPQGPGSGSNRIERGGSWDNYPRRVRSANRFRYSPGLRYNNLGFRLVASGRR